MPVYRRKWSRRIQIRRVFAFTKRPPVTLQATSNGVSATTAALTRGVLLQATSSGVSTTVGNLNLGFSLQATSNGVSATSASLTAGHRLQAQSDGISTLSATLTDTSAVLDALQAIIYGQSSVSVATLTRGVTFSTDGRDSLYPIGDFHYIVMDAVNHKSLGGHEPTYEAALMRLRRHAIKTGGEHQLFIKRVPCEWPEA